MTTSRRAFLATSATALGAAALRPRALVVDDADRAAPRPAGFDPWLEIDAPALAHNVAEVSRLTGGRPILAVVKNNAYGLGLGLAGPALAALPQVDLLAVVTSGDALALRAAGVRKAILLMARVEDDLELDALVRADVRLAPFGDDAPARLARLAARHGRAIPIHLYLDSGMSRLGMPVQRAGPWVEALARERGVRIEGAFTELAETDFDDTQVARFRDFAARARTAGITLGRLHAASSHALFFRRDAYLDAVRPGLALYGAYPAGAVATGLAPLRPAFRLRARVVRVERLVAGEAVSYGRSYVARQPTWIATLPIGHTDGYPRGAVKGCEVLIGARTYAVIGAVSAGHTIIEVGGGDEPSVAVGDVATLVGPERPAILPNAVAERAQVSVYDILMHLSPTLPRVARQAGP